jgi:small subunit ribosomal protein S1
VEEQGISALPLEGGTTAEEYVHPMSELLDEEFSRVVPERGEIIEGTIVSITSSEVMVDIACKSEGLVSSRDLERLDPEYRHSLKVGDRVWVYVVRPEDAQGNIILSLSRAQIETDWQKAAEIFDAGDIIEEAVVGANRGGLIVNVGRVRGFVPASQVYSVRLPAQADDAEREERLSQVVGDKLHLKIIELDRRRNRLILSERAATREWRQAQKERLLDDLKEGDIRRGVVSSLCDFGAFVDLGGADGLVHLSELSWSRVGHPKEVLKVDQEVDVYVLGVDRERRRIALSIKRLKPEPWSTVTERYQIGQVVTGTITNITDFGAFARLDEDIEGLIHISELSEERIDHPNAVVKEGDEVTVRIIRIDPDRQRMGLSMRRVNDDPYFEQYDWEESDQLAEPEDSAEDSES